jgi:hypothetical protein
MGVHQLFSCLQHHPSVKSKEVTLSMATTKNPQVMYIGSDTHTKIVLNTTLSTKVLTIVISGNPVLSLSAIEAQELLDLLTTRAYSIEHLAHEIRACLYNYPVK